MSSPPSDASSPVVDLASLIRARRAEIIARFVEDVPRRELSPPGLTRSLLIDHVPAFLDEIVAELSRDSAPPSLEPIEASPAARQHGGQRWSLGYDLEGLIREYGVLRHAILRAAKEAELVVSIDEFDTLSACINVGVVEAANAFAHHGAEQVRAQRESLEFLAEAGQTLTSSLDRRSTLKRVTRLVVPRLADWCVVHVEGLAADELPVGHVDPSREEAVREVFRGRPWVADSLWNVTRDGPPEPIAIAEVSDTDLERLTSSSDLREGLKSLGIGSIIIVPLVVQAQVFGSISLVYGASERHHDAADLVVASELARRAAVAIDNARLYELSQGERARVEAATRVKDEFVALVSHELRTPLNSILGWTRLLRSGGLPEGKRDHALEVVERSALAQNQLVTDLLDVSRVITGKLRISPAQVDVKNLVEMAVEGMRPAANAKSIAIQLSLDGDLQIRADGDRLGQVFWNLLTNAVKFTPKYGRVTISGRREASDVVVEVTDTGRGIPSDFLPHVFENFRQLDASTARVHGGLGIGLSVAQHIVELHGGTITPYSDGIDKGARFVVRLPVMPLVSTTMGISKVPAATGDEPRPTMPRTGAGLRVLVVDDESDARDLIGYLLQAVGMEVRLAGSVAEALEAYDAFDADLLISDIGMPGEDGYSLIRSVRTLPKEAKRGIPAIALTAFARNEDRTRALVAGFNLHIAKPVEPSALVAAALELVGRPAAVDGCGPSAG